MAIGDWCIQDISPAGGRRMKALDFFEWLLATCQ
jgi:hypothetical protein